MEVLKCTELAQNRSRMAGAQGAALSVIQYLNSYPHVQAAECAAAGGRGRGSGGSAGQRGRAASALQPHPHPHRTASETGLSPNEMRSLSSGHCEPLVARRLPAGPGPAALGGARPPRRRPALDSGHPPAASRRVALCLSAGLLSILFCFYMR